MQTLEGMRAENNRKLRSLYCDLHKFTIEEAQKFNPYGNASKYPDCFKKNGCMKCEHFKGKTLFLELERYAPDYNRHICKECNTELLRRVKSYAPYCDSTYEEFLCPNCGAGFSQSI